MYKSDLSPPQVYRHQMSLIDSENIILFGGINENNQKFNEIYYFEFNDKRWTILFPSGEYPSPRTYHNMVLCNQSILVFGGYSNVILNDCYILNLSEKYFNQKEIGHSVNDYKVDNNLNNKYSKLEKPNTTIFIDATSKNNSDEVDNIASSIDIALGLSENNANKQRLLITEYREEIKILKNQVNELKQKIDAEINKNSCKVNKR